MKRRNTVTLARRAGRPVRGSALAYVTGTLVLVLLVTGLAVDLGRAYVVRMNLSNAVDAAAFAGAKKIGEGQTAARAEAVKMFNVNFPTGLMGVTPQAPTIAFSYASDGSSVVTVSSSAPLSTTFSRIAGFNTVNVGARSSATRRLLDLAFVIDHSGSIGSQWSDVQDAATQFIDYFDPASDRLSLILFSTSTVVADAIRTSGRGFDKTTIVSHINAATSSGSTASAEGLYQGWDQLRSVPSGTQSALRVVVLFTDGSPNTFPGTFSVAKPSGGTQNVDGSVMTPDFPDTGVYGSTNSPYVVGVFQTFGTVATAGNMTFISPTDYTYASTPSGTTTTVDTKIPTIPSQSNHTQQVSSGIPKKFNLYDPSLSGQRVLIGGSGSTYPNHVRNSNNAARNLFESVANAVRADNSGAFPIKIYTLGLGDELNMNMGSVPETGTSILQRIANDRNSTSYNSAQPTGKYYFAGDTAQLKAAFEALHNEIVRFSE